MGFSTGRATFLRFAVAGTAPRVFDETHVEALSDHAIGRERLASADGVEGGWSAGGHVLDTDFSLEKNVHDDVMLFDLRIDQDRPPGDLLRAYYETELKALAADNPSGKPNARQKREAKGIARDRMEEEAKDGRFRKRKCVPVLWDRHAGEAWLGAASPTHADRFAALFEKTFGLTVEAVPAGRRAVRHAEVGGRVRAVEDAAPAEFVPGTTPAEYAWVADSSGRDWLGNEFLLWLWWYSDSESDTVKVADDTEVTFMIAGSLSLDCPRGQTGSETIRHDGPARLPEARRAVQAGKMPRRCGLTLVRRDQQYDLTLAAELLAVSGAKVPPPGDDVSDARGVVADRLDKLRSLAETLDLLYGAFLDRRLDAKRWPDELARVRQWLGVKEPRA